MRKTWFQSIGVLAALASLSPGAPAAQGGSVRIIEISAERFEFRPSEIVVEEGEEVELRLRSEDTAHGFRLAGTDVNLTLPKRGKGYAAARFTAAGPGRHVFECSRMCGAGHSFMRGVLIVRPAASGDRR
jgi:cytochrome c oxidase subunit 2